MVNRINNEASNKNIMEANTNISQSKDRINKVIIDFYQRNISRFTPEEKKKYEETFPEAIAKFNAENKKEVEKDIAEIKLDFMKDVFPGLSEDEKLKYKSIFDVKLKT